MLKKKSFALAVAFTALSALSGYASAAEKKVAAVTTPPSKMPAAIANAQKSGGLEVIKEFQAIGGLKGWVVKEPSGQNIVVYTTPDGEGLIAGILLDSAGRNMTNVYATEHVPPVDYGPAYKAFVSEAASAVVGKSSAKAELTVVFDGNCGYCKLLHKLLTPSVEAGELRVRYVPVAIMGADSPAKGAALLAGKASVSAIAAGETSSDKDLIAKVMKNTELMKTHRFNGTPVVMYKAGKGSSETLYVSPGVPNIKEMFSRLGISGQLDKLKDDQSLSRFLE